MRPISRCLFLFLGGQSFLIGIFPFFIPVYLFSQGKDFSAIALFIALTGIGFCLWLSWFDIGLKKKPLNHLILLSFVWELLLLSVFLIETPMIQIVAGGIVNGLFNANFWILQRLLFIETIDLNNSGRKFGNFQIFVFIFLKIGIFLGGMLLDLYGVSGVFYLSLASVLFSLFIIGRLQPVELSRRVVKNHYVKLKEIVQFKDLKGSRAVFLIDGLFLYLESYFWVITLFIVVQESFWSLGILVIVLALFFSLSFLFIKNTIDKMNSGIIYYAGVFLYVLSWVLRSVTTEEIPKLYLLLNLATITFCTSFFRLTFNKRFFDIAQRELIPHRYIFIKSYISQFFLAICCLFGSVFWFCFPMNVTGLSWLYLCAAVVGIVFFFYRESDRPVISY